MLPILEVDNVSKKFLIHHRTGGYLNLRDSISSIFKPSKWSRESFWALKNISFNVNAGESLAVIGRNGAGKSTLLKILSRITPPSSGTIKSRGRISSLLEVGTGFHPELSGRENIFFNGSLLGMRKVEIQKKFDAIVDFSGTEKFLDTPLKHFSSGMQLRLAFSVAAFLESEVLILDEVLAVGDADFQKKCIGKIDDVTKSGRTIIFVSHNMSVVRSLCNKAVVLEAGTITFTGTVNEGVDHYLSSANTDQETPGEKDLTTHPNKKNHEVGMTSIRLLREGKPSSLFFPGEPMIIEVNYQNIMHHTDVVLGIVVKDMNQQAVIGLNNLDLGLKFSHEYAPATGKIVMEIPRLPIYGNSTYFIDLFLGDSQHNFEVIESAISFHIEPFDVYKTGRILNEKINQVLVEDVKMKQYNAAP